YVYFVYSEVSPPQKWVYFNGSLYQVSSTKKTWNQSRSDCRQKGADLLLPTGSRSNMWIGLTDVTNEGSWKWEMSCAPLLFCIGLNPLSQIITKSGFGF
uniref:C-type lectin domain-containing protein n=1 Tax=Takifugu rubripes TaxID=31033 RepID=A0A674MRW6_TAKRU